MSGYIGPGSPAPIFKRAARDRWLHGEDAFHEAMKAIFRSRSSMSPVPPVTQRR